MNILFRQYSNTLHRTQVSRSKSNTALLMGFITWHEFDTYAPPTDLTDQNTQSYTITQLLRGLTSTRVHQNNAIYRSERL